MFNRVVDYFNWNSLRLDIHSNRRFNKCAFINLLALLLSTKKQ